jgi:hypothetical protein
MRTRSCLALSFACLFSISYAADWSGEWKPFRASYTIYSGELTEREAPKPADRTMTIAVEGPPAKEIFDSIAPDIHPACGNEKGDRGRRKKGVDCVYSAHGAAKGYRCWIGINLRSGDSVPTVSC